MSETLDASDSIMKRLAITLLALLLLSPAARTEPHNPHTD